MKLMVIFAGLVPQLRAQPGWRITQLRPGPQPFQALAGALIDLLEDNPSAVERLKEMGVDEITPGIGQTGVVAVIKGKTDTSGRVIGMRASSPILPLM